MSKSFITLTDAVDVLLHEKHYKPRTISGYHFFWNQILKFMEKNHVSDFSYEVGEQFYKEACGLSLTDPYELRSSFARRCHRPITALLQYQQSGTISNRRQVKNHDFDPCFQPAIGKFMEMIGETLSRRTRREFQTHMEIFLSYLLKNGCRDLSVLSKSDILAFWESRSHLCKVTKEMDSYVFRKFFSYLYEKGYTHIDNSIFVPKVRGNHKGKIPSYCTVEEITKLLSAVDRSSPLGKRDFAILLLAARYGMRVGDIRNLKLSDIDWNTSVISFVISKTGVRTTLPLLDDIATALIDYFQNGRPETTCRNVFVRHNAPYDEFGENDNLHHIITKYMHFAGFTDLHNKKHGLHTLRHSIAGNMLDQGIPMATISEIMGHSSTETTMIYTKIGVSQLRSCALEVE